MAFVKMKPPVGVTVGLGADGKLYYVDQRGFANVDSGSVSKLTSEGWTSVTDSPPGKSLDSVFAQVDPVTGRVSFSPIGGRNILADSGVSPLPQGSNTAVLLGDSYTAQCVYGWINPTSSGYYSATDNIFNAIGLWPMLNAWLGGPWNIVWNSGIPGNRTDQWKSRIATDVAQYDPAYVLIFGGYINDVAQGKTADQIIANLTDAYTQMRGRRIIHATGIPVVASGYTDTYSKRQVQFEVFKWLTCTAESLFPNLLVLDCYSPLLDISTGGMISGAGQADAIHPADKGISLVLPSAYAKCAAAGIAGKSGFGGYNDWNNLLVNVSNPAAGYGGIDGVGYFGNGTGGINGGKVNAHWFATNEYGGAADTATWSTVARTDGIAGKWSRVSIPSGGTTLGLTNFLDRWSGSNTAWSASAAKTTNAAVVPTAGNNGFIYYATGNGTTGATEPVWPTHVGASVVDGSVTWVAKHLPSPGDKIKVRIEARFPNAATQSGTLNFKLKSTGGPNATAAWCFNNSTALTPPSQNIVIDFPALLIPSASISELRLILTASANGGAGLDFDIGRAYVYVESRANYPM